MFQSKIKQILNDTKPYAERLASDAIKGYTFGCIFGMFTNSKKPMYTEMHRNGKNFAKMAAVYSATDMLLEKIRSKDDALNSFTAGIIAGAVGSKQNTLKTSMIFGLYSGISKYANNEFKQ